MHSLIHLLIQIGIYLLMQHLLPPLLIHTFEIVRQSWKDANFKCNLVWANLLILLVFKMYHFNISGFSIISQTAFSMYRSREPTFFYICLGKFPTKFLNVKIEKNVTMNFAVTMAFLTQICLTLRFIIYKYKVNQVENRQRRQPFSIHSYVTERLSSESLFRSAFY
jgi:hypothetical protein